MKYQNIWILDEFEKRQNKNSRYSLRAFANAIGVSPGLVSKAFNGENCISLNTAKRILNTLPYEDEIKNQIIDQYRKSEEKETLIKERLKRILNDKKEIKVKSLDSNNFSRVSKWQHTLLYYLIDLMPIDQSFEEQLNYLEYRSTINLKDIKQYLRDLESLDLITIKEEKNLISKNYERFYYNGHENKKGAEDLRDDFSQAAIKLANIGAMTLYPEKINGKDLKQESPHAHGTNLVNWDFFILDKDTAFSVERIINNMYKDIQKVADLEKNENAEIYCMNSQFFKATRSLR